MNDGCYHRDLFQKSQSHQTNLMCSFLPGSAKVQIIIAVIFTTIIGAVVIGTILSVSFIAIPSNGSTKNSSHPSANTAPSRPQFGSIKLIHFKKHNMPNLTKSNTILKTSWLSHSFVKSNFSFKVILHLRSQGLFRIIIL